MTAPALVYLAMGMLVARIMLDGVQTRGFRWLRWTQFLFEALRITLLWPLVLLVDKVVAWLKAGAEVSPALNAQGGRDPAGSQPIEGERS